MTQVPSFPKVTPRRVVLATIVVALVGAGFWLLYLFRHVALILFLAIVLSLAIRPAVEWLNKNNLPRAVGIAIVYLALLTFFILFVLLLVPLIANQLASIIAGIPDNYREVRSFMLNSPNFLLWRLGIELPSELPFLAPVGGEEMEEETMTTVGQAWEYVTIIIRGFFLTLAVLVTAFYWTLDGERTIRTLLLLAPQEWRAGIRELITAVEIKVGGYIFGQVILCVVIAGLNLIAFVLIGLPYPLILALIAGVMEAVPMVGPALGAVPAILLALSLGEPDKILWIVVATLFIQQFENAFLVPRIMRKAVGVNPLVTLLSLLAFSSVLGVVGAVIAIPIAAIIQLLVDRFLLTPDETVVNEEIPGRDYASRLRYEVQELTQDVRKQVRAKSANAELDNDEIEDEIEQIATELDLLLAEINPPEASS